MLVPNFFYNGYLTKQQMDGADTTIYVVISHTTS